MSLIGRALTILLLPIVIFVFVVGWVSYRTSEAQTRIGVKKSQTPDDGSTSANPENGEVGIIEELMENLLKA
jgi:hypothetical protein